MLDQGSLTTGTSKDGQLLPDKPGSWTQTFSISTVDKLWERHESALNHLCAVTSARVAQGPPNLAEDFMEGIRREGAYVRSLTLGPLRVPFWYFFRRSARHNKSVQQLMDG